MTDLVNKYYQPQLGAGKVTWHNDRTVVEKVVDEIKDLPPLEQKAMTDLLDLAPTGNLSEEELLDVVDGLGALFELLNQESVLPQDLTDLMIEICQQMGWSASQARRAANLAAKQALLFQADQSRQQADAMKDGAAKSLALGSLAAGTTIGFSAASAFYVVKAAKSMNKATNLSKEMQAAKKELNDNKFELDSMKADELKSKIDKADLKKEIRTLESELPTDEMSPHLEKTLDDLFDKKIELESMKLDEIQSKMDQADLKKEIRTMEAKLSADETTMSVRTGRGQEYNNKSQQITTAASGVSQGLGNSATAVSSFSQADVKNSEARSQTAGAEQTSEQQKAESAKEIGERLRDFIRALVEYAKVLGEQKSAQMASLTR